MEIVRKTYFALTLEDKPGALAALMADLEAHDADFEGVWGFGRGKGQGQAILVPKNVEGFKAIGQKLELDPQEGICFKLTERDRAGLLVDTLKKIADKGINLHSIDAVSVKGEVGCYIWPEAKDVEVVGRVLQA